MSQTTRSSATRRIGIVVATVLGLGLTLLAPATFAQSGRGQRPKITSVQFSQSLSSLTVTVNGTGFGSRPHPSPRHPVACQPGDTGFDYGARALWFQDTTEGWTAGQYIRKDHGYDCVGLVITSWSNTTVVFGFGSEYNNEFGPVNHGDSVAVAVRGRVHHSVVP